MTDPDRILLLSRGPGKCSPLDTAVTRIGRQRGLSVERRTGTPFDVGPETLVLVRKSELSTGALERRTRVYPDERTRHRSRNKRVLHRYCLERRIPTPKTLAPDRLLERFVFKTAVGSSGSLVDPFADRDLLVQERIRGPVVKCYGNVDAEDFVGYDELDGHPVRLPERVSEISRQVLRDYGLLYGGLDWIVGDRWYLIDVNATTGFGHACVEAAVKLLTQPLARLLSGEALSENIADRLMPAGMHSADFEPTAIPG